MPAIWTPPATWSVNQLVTAADMNTQLRDNLEWLKTPPMAQVVLDQAADYVTTSTSFAPVDTSVLSLTINVVGGNVLVGFHGTIEITGGNRFFLDVAVNGVRTAGDDGIFGSYRVTSGTTPPVSFARLITGVAAGSRTFRLQWRVSGGTATLFAGAGTTNWDIHPQFWVREV